MKTFSVINYLTPFAIILMGAIGVPKGVATTLIGNRYGIDAETAPGSNIYYRLGEIYEHLTDLTLEEFYNYQDYKYNGVPLDFQKDQAHIFLVRSTINNQLGLFSINGSPYETSTSILEINYKIDGGIFGGIAVADEPTEVKQIHDQWVHGLYGWCNNFSDGAVLPIIANNPNSITLSFEIADLFEQLEGKHLGCAKPFRTTQNLVFLSAAPNGNVEFGSMFGQKLERGLSFRMNSDPVSASVSEPSSIKGLLVLGILGGGLLLFQRPQKR